MPDSISSSIIQSLNAMKHNSLVIGSTGDIRFASDHWEDFNRLYGFSSAGDWLELNVLELFRQKLADPDGMVKLEQLLCDIFKGIRLVASAQLTLLTGNNGSRIFHLDIFPLLTEQQAPAHQTAVLTLRDIGPSPNAEESAGPALVTQCSSVVHLHPSPQLVPICAACKSVRSSQEEWITIERFLKLQLSLQFTHDICPDCIRELYPKYAAALKW
ncbi:hypothetical protein [Paenibacillus sp. IHB B 3415]|uniref:hypothetical protein n=1 Tax=Paenibacillus sp. IHB B 3415 TaxID=867080 RepID=UPI00069A402B|nr:hypothetical protein [Paenibacillus sp. IHB B 3415]